MQWASIFLVCPASPLPSFCHVPNLGVWWGCGHGISPTPGRVDVRSREAKVPSKMHTPKWGAQGNRTFVTELETMDRGCWEAPPPTLRGRLSMWEQMGQWRGMSRAGEGSGQRKWTSQNGRCPRPRWETTGNYTPYDRCHSRGDALWA